MNRLLSQALACAMALGFIFSATAANAGTTTKHNAMHSTMHSTKMMKQSCPTGKHWVKPYKRNGKWVKGYCR